MSVVVAVLGLDNAIGFEFMIPGQVFGMANLSDSTDRWDSSTALDAPVRGETAVPQRYEVRLCSRRQSFTTGGRWGETKIRTPFGLQAATDADIVVIPGTESFLDTPHPEVSEVLREAVGRGARVAAVCVGAFTVAAAGLLDGRRATTHWLWASELARRHPSIDVDSSVLFVDDGNTLTSAGMASGIDLCLHLIRSDAGAELAARTARRLVVPAWRNGGQSQYVEHLDPVDTSNTLQSTIEWMEANLSSPLNLKAIAEQASMSVRSLNRQFRIHVGTTPHQLLLQMRVDRARRLLESTRLPLDRVAEESGFGSQPSLRYHFSRAVGAAPQNYRSTYLDRVGRHGPSAARSHQS
ncbi:GlxA family transcriptional regulator [Mycobacterium deserti]|uniref:Helix-turn-helix domain-containing protein n=1 Tax=Mycobacterium deserti TaxID=2978347 RepID=A0ABT2MHU7_9MYCO|nr:helix-turn-helix domain-containing protein [Mycobacterium deserti]MCT7661851.1 helix-turn-helix domain-containing protein [Mycobacterium deserti]